MLILCPNCATSYNVEASSLGATGRSVRCVSCRSIWFAAPPDAALPKATSRVADAVAEAEAAFDTLDAELAERETTTQSLDAAPGEASALGESAVLDPTEPAFPGANGEAEPELVNDAPPIAPVDLDGHPPPDGELAGSDIESIATRRSRRPIKRRHSPIAGLPAAILVLVALNAILIGWRHEVVRLVPQTASLYAAIGLPVNLRGLSFANVKMTRDTQDGVQVLMVEGTIAATAGKAVEVPRLRFSVRDGKGREIYAWTALPAKSVLGPDETLPFRSRLASPPAEANDVLVRFFNRRDLVAGIP